MVQSQEAPKQETPTKKSGSKRKGEPGTPDCDSPLFLPYKTIISIVGSMVFNEREARLVRSSLRRLGLLEDKEKLLATEQEDAAVAKSKLRELNKEVASETAIAAAGEAKVKKRLVAREQESQRCQLPGPCEGGAAAVEPDPDSSGAAGKRPRHVCH
ncbi:Ribosome-binding protein 1 [Microtus ochrogaster]|uniref:Ribosome-binding protein 1 n=1 Tax=Microtus ochrogaster TaxID=79684 RepID=A0A8J6G797_MICOH|nr:Ribosome-binding protein 1 [Microtus ochrogaster]